MKIVIILVVFLIVAGGAGGGAYWWFFMREEGEPEEEVVDLGPPPVYLEMPSLTIPVIRGGAVARYIVLKVSLELVDKSMEEDVNERIPRLRDAFLRDLHGYFGTIPVGERLNVLPVKKRLAKVSRAVLGKGVVQDILITNAFSKDG